MERVRRRETKTTLIKGEGGEAIGNREGKEARFEHEKVSRGGREATRDNSAASVMQRDERTNVGEGGERGPTRGGIIEEGVDEGTVQNREGFFGRAPFTGGNGTQSAYTREGFGLQRARVGLHGEGTVQGDTKEGGSGVEVKRGTGDVE